MTPRDAEFLPRVTDPVESDPRNGHSRPQRALSSREA
jgi:hypothetical protein